MSLPFALKTTLATVPVTVPYLHADAAKRSEWQMRLGPHTRRRIGLAWAGNPTHSNDHHRSMPFEKLRPLLDADAEFHCLHKAVHPTDRAWIEADGRMRIHSEDLHDFGDTAALIANLDLVITVDTAVAHVAGALGKPVWVLLSFVPDFRWLVDRNDSPWYPTARLFRQPRRGDWPSVTAHVIQALRA
jgi:hypothetical protein